MTVQPYEQPGDGTSNGEIVQYRPEGRSVSTLREWAEAARLAHVVATSLVKTSFVPVAYRGKPDEATAAILAGDELGLSPMASLKAFASIQGVASAYAMTLRAVVQRHGHQIEKVSSSSTRCVMRGRRAGEQTWQQVEWTIERATRLGVVARNPEWRKQPETMLIARATAELCRLVAADAIMGIPYAVEELSDQEGAGAASGPTRTRRRTPVAAVTAAPQAPVEPRAPAGPPPLPGEDWADDSGEPAAEPATDADETDAELVDTPDELAEADDEAADEPAADAEEGDGEPDMAYLLRYTFALLGQAEVPDRHAYASEILGRAVQSYSELSADDLQKLIDDLHKRTRGK